MLEAEPDEEEARRVGRDATLVARVARRRRRRAASIQSIVWREAGAPNDDARLEHRVRRRAGSPPRTSLSRPTRATPACRERRARGCRSARRRRGARARIRRPSRVSAVARDITGQIQSNRSRPSRRRGRWPVSRPASQTLRIARELERDLRARSCRRRRRAPGRRAGRTGCGIRSSGAGGSSARAAMRRAGTRGRWNGARRDDDVVRLETTCLPRRDARTARRPARATRHASPSEPAGRTARRSARGSPPPRPCRRDAPAARGRASPAARCSAPA